MRVKNRPRVTMDAKVAVKCDSSTQRDGDHMIRFVIGQVEHTMAPSSTSRKRIVDTRSILLHLSCGCAHHAEAEGVLKTMGGHSCYTGFASARAMMAGKEHDEHDFAAFGDTLERLSRAARNLRYSREQMADKGGVSVLPVSKQVGHLRDKWMRVFAQVPGGLHVDGDDLIVAAANGSTTGAMRKSNGRWEIRPTLIAQMNEHEYHSKGLLVEGGQCLCCDVRSSDKHIKKASHKERALEALFNAIHFLNRLGKGAGGGKRHGEVPLDSTMPIPGPGPGEVK